MVMFFSAQEECGVTRMQFSLRTLLLIVLVLGTTPLWWENFLLPFFLILVVCIGMSVHAFGESSRNEQS